MAWKVIFSARSRTDLEQIVKYIARDDAAAAERFALKLIAQAESLADAPRDGAETATKAKHAILSGWSLLNHLSAG